MLLGALETLGSTDRSILFPAAQYFLTPKYSQIVFKTSIWNSMDDLKK